MLLYKKLLLMTFGTTVVHTSKLDEVVTLLASVREVPSSSLGLGTDYPGYGLSCISSISSTYAE